MDVGLDVLTIYSEKGSHISGICRFLDFVIIRQMSVKILKLNLNILWTHSEWQICSCTRWMSQVYGYFEQAVRPSASATMQEALALAFNKSSIPLDAVNDLSAPLWLR